MVTVTASRVSLTKVSYTGDFAPPARAIRSRRRSPLSDSGTLAPLTTSPDTVAALVTLFVITTITCGSIALSARRCSIVCWTSSGDFPATEIRSANGTLIAPSRATTCSGMVTLREPGEIPVVTAEPKSPPAAASQMVTVIVSPIPILGSGGLPYLRNRERKLSPDRSKSVETTLSFTSTISKRAWSSLTDWSTTWPVVGPAVGNVEHPPTAAPNKQARATANLIVWCRRVPQLGHFLSERPRKQKATTVLPSFKGSSEIITRR